ncbi:MAG: C45 family autoproteolytic acyltransferase/hydrolase [Thermovirgaceae bacterium]
MKPVRRKLIERIGAKRVLAAILLFVFLMWAAPIEACTLWAATGSGTAEGYTILAKNRDWKPGQSHALQQVRSREGYSYLGLFAFDGDSPGLKGGINEKGLAVVTATASVIPKNDRSADGGDPISSNEILTSYATVDEVIAQKDRFTRSSYYMVADARKVAVFEGAPDGKTAVRVIDNGFLAQTNHYVSSELKWFNDRASKSSKTRYERITSLLSDRQGQLAMEDFVTFSEDRNAGTDNSVFRTGSDSRKSRTVATWIIAIPKEGSPELYVKMKDPGEDFRAYSGSLDAEFWGVRTASAARNDS